jgi:hypothetical protein
MQKPALNARAFVLALLAARLRSLMAASLRSLMAASLRSLMAARFAREFLCFTYEYFRK